MIVKLIRPTDETHNTHKHVYYQRLTWVGLRITNGQQL